MIYTAKLYFCSTVKLYDFIPSIKLFSLVRQDNNWPCEVNWTSLQFCLHNSDHNILNITTSPRLNTVSLRR